MAETAELPELDPCMLLHVRLRVHRLQRNYSTHPETLPDEAIVPCLSQELGGGNRFAQVRVAVGTNAMFFQVDVQGKTTLPWCRDSRLEDSDGLHLWIDTRPSREIHRATRFCHRFGLLPLGRGPKADLPYFGWTSINRARANSPMPPDELMSIRSRVADGKYRIVAALHFDALHGLNLEDFPTIGFYFAVQDRELGMHCLTHRLEAAVTENPSLWTELVMV
ncbi:MAG: hypothetical protein KF752_19980 [Pirellulaceae bacterium]|nr:hypothetical protein [Pirellulaceae bacterium]